MNKEKELLISVYSRPECHLCDEMLNALKEWQKHINFKVNVFNIDDDPILTSRYAARIPLLAINGTEICEYHFDENAFLQYLENNK